MLEVLEHVVHDISTEWLVPDLLIKFNYFAGWITSDQVEDGNFHVSASHEGALRPLLFDHQFLICPCQLVVLKLELLSFDCGELRCEGRRRHWS